MNMHGGASSWSILLVFIIVVSALLYALWPEGKTFEEATGLKNVALWQRVRGGAIGVANDTHEIVSRNEEQFLINEWIFNNHLNEYGDQPGAVYLGGTPLFNEGTGETINRYDYIISRHPDKPWRE